MKQGDDAFNSQNLAAMNAVHHPDMIAHIPGSAEPIRGRAAHRPSSGTATRSPRSSPSGTPPCRPSRSASPNSGRTRADLAANRSREPARPVTSAHPCPARTPGSLDHVFNLVEEDRRRPAGPGVPVQAVQAAGDEPARHRSTVGSSTPRSAAACLLVPPCPQTDDLSLPGVLREDLHVRLDQARFGRADCPECRGTAHVPRRDNW